MTSYRNAVKEMLNKPIKSIAVMSITASLIAGMAPAVAQLAYADDAQTQNIEQNASTDNVSQDAIEYNGQTDYDKETVYTISTFKQIKQLADAVNNGVDYSGVTFQLTDDIDMGGMTIEPIGVGYFSSSNASEQHAFAGTFDGNRHKISRFAIEQTDEEKSLDASDTGKTSGNNYKYNETNKYKSKGLFGYATGTIKNLSVSSADITGWNASGAIVGYLDGGTITNCSVSDSTVSSTFENAGGLIGRTSGNVNVTGNTVSDTVVSVPENGKAATNSNQNGAGGLIGRTQGGDIVIASNTVNDTTVNAYRKAAGIIGYILQPKSISVNANDVDNVSINVNEDAKNNDNDTYNGIITAEIQANPNTVRGYEKVSGDGAVSIEWTGDKETAKTDLDGIANGIKSQIADTIATADDGSSKTVIVGNDAITEYVQNEANADVDIVSGDITIDGAVSKVSNSKDNKGVVRINGENVTAGTSATSSVSDQVSALKDKIEALTEQLDDANADLEKTKNDAKNASDKSATDLKEAQSALADAEKNVNDLKKQLEDAATQLSELNRTIAEQDTSNADLKNALDEAQSALKTADDSLDSANKALYVAEDTIDNLKKQITDLNNVVKAKAKSIKNFKVKTGKKKAVASWKKSKGYKYQLKYQKKSSKKQKVTTVKYQKTAKNKVIVKNLKKNKKYTFKVRAYKKINGKTVYGKWSNGVTVKIK